LSAILNLDGTGSFADFAFAIMDPPPPKSTRSSIGWALNVERRWIECWVFSISGIDLKSQRFL
ncbi:MAG: hypothetical protein KDD43_03580, partial [Bdellovibrionales bacterium]|nr:hypothetical protein [Bdellovibrionales bacterium]